jgi:hypothetical protein
VKHLRSWSGDPDCKVTNFTARAHHISEKENNRSPHGLCALAHVPKLHLVSGYITGVGAISKCARRGDKGGLKCAQKLYKASMGPVASTHVKYAEAVFEGSRSVNKLPRAMVRACL